MPPCWIRGGEVPAELTLVHAWNEMVQLQVDANGDGAATASRVREHLTGICEGLCQSAPRKLSA